MGVSRKCVNTCIDRHAAEGETGLITRSSRPHTMPTKTSDNDEHKVLAGRGPSSVTALTSWARKSVSRRGQWRGFCVVTACPICASATR